MDQGRFVREEIRMLFLLFTITAIYAAPAPQLEQLTSLLGGANPAGQLTGLLGNLPLPGGAGAAGANGKKAAGGLDLPVDIGALANPAGLLGQNNAAAGTASQAPVAKTNNFANAAKPKTQ